MNRFSVAPAIPNLNTGNTVNWRLGNSIVTAVTTGYESTSTKRSNEMPIEIISVKGMSCMGCVNKVKTAWRIPRE